MKSIILTKRHILAALCCCLAAGAAVFFGVRGAAAPAAAEKRLIPIYNVQTEKKQVAISFDAAWGNEQTQELIDILKQHEVKTTFFVVGDWAAKYPDSIRALIQAGHEVGNHSDTHPHMPTLSRAEITAQIEACNQKIGAVTGGTPTLFRAPYGDYSNSVLEAASALNMYTIQWDVDSLDWKNPTPQEIADRVLSQVKPGSIVLFHNGAKNTPAALPQVLERLKENGYEIVPVSQLILKDHYTIDNAGMQIPEKLPQPKSGESSSTSRPLSAGNQFNLYSIPKQI